MGVVKGGEARGNGGEGAAGRGEGKTVASRLASGFCR